MTQEKHKMAVDAFFNNPHTGFLVCNRKGQIDVINNSMAAHFGNTADDLKRQSLFKYLDRENAALLSGFLQANSNDVLVLKVNLSNHSEREYELKISATGENQERLFSGIATPLPTYKELQDKYKTELAELRSRFLSIASHEFKIPLTGLMSSLNLIERYLEAAGEEWEKFSYKDKIEKHMNIFKTGLRNLENIINEFLSISKIEQGKIQIRNEKFNLEDFFNKHKNFIIQTLKPEQRLYYECISCDTDIITDRNFLHSIISNLVYNAIKYSPANSRITVSAKTSKGMLTVHVTDEGMGIAQSEQDRIFKHFYRAENAQNYQGAGLGLTISKQYTEIMGGSITLKSKIKQGSTFTIKIPINP